MLNFNDLKILVLGDVMLDEYLYSTVSRISPEAPVAVATIKRRSATPGGAANVARNLARLGCQVALGGFAGEDDSGRELEKILEKEGIGNLVHTIRDYSTICKTRVIAQGHQLLRLDREETGGILPEAYESLWKKIEKDIPGFNSVILSDYNKGVLSYFQNGNTLAQRVIQSCAKCGIPVLVDPKGKDWSRYRNASCVTPNTGELAQILNVNPEQYGELLSGARELIKSLQLGNIILTRSEKGMALIEGDGDVQEIAANAREVIDVSGAGDTVIAVAGAGAAKGFDWLEAAKMANLAGGIVVSKAGTAPIESFELNEAIRREQEAAHSHAYKICDSPDGLQGLIKSWRQRGQSIVFTNGCFDLIHVGHIQLLREAAQQADKLIVAVNSDASVKRLKGESRPMQSERERAQIIAAFQDVDAVVIFNEDTPLELIKSISPDVLVKGGDYEIRNVVGAEHVLEHGGKVHIANYLHGHSTSSIIGRMRQPGATD